jgi:hypothetical protein
VAVPIVSGANRLITYGTLEIGVVPRFALTEKAIPNDSTINPHSKVRHRNIVSLRVLLFVIVTFPQIAVCRPAVEAGDDLAVCRWGNNKIKTSVLSG